MGVSKEAKDKIIGLLLQDVPTDLIASELGYSIGTVRNVFEELREKYGVNTTKEIKNIYLSKELNKLSNHIEEIQKIIRGCNFTPSQKSRRNLQKHQKRKKN